MNQSSSTQIRLVIKKLLKKRDSGYSDLAKALGLSTQGVKRLMTKGDFTLARLEQISAWFGLSLFELMEIAKEVRSPAYKLNLKQESVLAKKPRALYVLLLLGAGLPLTEIRARAQMTNSEFESCLFALDKINVIEHGSNGRVRILARGPFKWLKNGPLSKKYQGAFLDQLAGLVQTDPSPDSLQIPFELYLSNRLAEQMRNELSSVFEKYRGLSRVEHEIAEATELHPVSGLILQKPFDTWNALTRAP